MKDVSLFKIGLYVLLGIGIVFAVLIFSGKITVGKPAAAAISGNVVIWGTLPQDPMGLMTDVVHQTYKNVNVEYVQQDPATFQANLVNALASGGGPDMILLTPDDVISNHDRILEIPYTSLPQATFQSTFIDQGSQFLTDTGVLAFPLFVDPMVMYYNKDMLSSAFTVSPPATWDDVVALNKKITQVDDAGKLSTETVALGSFDNITHAKDILSNLIFQGGNSIVAWDPTVKAYVSQFGNASASGDSAVADALQFYTDFSNPTDAAHYSWNATLPNDETQFVAGNLAIYFGYASELASIRQQNPNLNFGVAMMPQKKGTTLKTTYGKMTGLAIMKVSKNIQLDVIVAQTMTSDSAISQYLSLDPTVEPARRDMLANSSADANQTLFYNSSIISRSFLDPDPVQTSALFQKYVNEINVGAAVPASIVAPGNSLLTEILQTIQKQTSGPAAPGI